LTPSVTIGITSGTNPTGSGDEVTFTATLINGGMSPIYQWKKGSTDVGTNSVTYTDDGTTGGIITCVMTVGTGICTNAATATSTGITLLISNAQVDIEQGVMHQTISPNWRLGLHLKALLMLILLMVSLLL
jgi:hypothetical protein